MKPDAALAAPRGGLPVDRILLAVDRALEPGVWFEEGHFSRAGEFAAPTQASGARAIRSLPGTLLRKLLRKG